MYARMTTMGLALLFALPTGAHAQFIWEGANNNNWDNNGNWSGASGWPDDPADNVVFNSSGNNRNVDLRGGDRDVGVMAITLLGSTDYSFDSNNNGSGTLRLNGNLDIAAIGDSVTFHDSTSDPGGGNGIDLVQAANGTWTNNGAVLTVHSNLVGGAQIEMYGNVTFNHANDYTGDFRIHSGVTTLSNANAFANAVVTLHQNDGLDVTGLATADLGALQGDGNLDIGGAVLNVGSRNSDRTFSGNLTGAGFLGAAFKYSGTDLLTLEGALSEMNSVTVESGELRFGGGSSSLTGDAELTLNGGDVSLVNGASLNVNTLSGPGGLVTLNSNTLTIDASTLSTGRILSNAAGTLDLTDPVVGPALIIGETAAGSQSSTFAGRLTGTGGFDKVGAGSWTLTNVNTFSGNAVIEGGSVIVANANALQNATVQVNIDNGLDFTAHSIDANLAGLAGAGNLDIGSQTLSLAGTGTDYGGVISGAGSLIKRLTGAQTLSGANTFSGGVTIVNGTLDIRDSAAAGAGDITAFSGTLAYANNITVSNNMTRTVSDNFTLQVGGGSATHAGVITDFSGRYGFTKSGGGSLVLAAANTYSGMTNINDGKIIVANTNALQNSTVAINVDGGLDVATNANLGGLAGSGNLNIGSQTVSVGANDADTSYSGDLTGEGTLIKQHASALTLDGGVSNLGALSHYGSGNLNIRGGSLDLTGETSRALYLRSATATRIEGGAVVTLTGSGGSNRTVLTNSAKLWVQDAGSSLFTPRLDIGPEGVGTAYVNVLGGAVIDAERIQIGDLALDNGAAGTLSVFDDAAVRADEIVLYRRGTIYVYGNGTLETDTLVDGDTEPHAILISDSLVGPSGPALTVGVNDGNSVVDALIEDSVAGSGSIRKVGTGTLELRNANTFSGGTTVDGGTVRANNTTGSATGGGGVAVSTGGTLGGNGSVAGMTVVESGGTVSPGASIGTLTLEDVSFDTNSTLAIEIADAIDHDQLVVTGTVTLGGSLDLSYLGEFSASPGDSFTILSAATLSDAFDTVNFPDAQTWTIEYGATLVTVTVDQCPDADSDGVCDDDDVCGGFDDNLDADGDGVPDGCDVCHGFDDTADVNSNGVPDGCETLPVHNRTQSTDHATLQLAIDASSNGDLIEADPGTYAELIDFAGKGITLRSTGGAAVTTIDASNVAALPDGKPVVRFDHGEGPDSVLEGFTLTGGTGDISKYAGYGAGGGVFSRDASPTITACIFLDNTATIGGGMYNSNGALAVTGCTFKDNSALVAGGYYAGVGSALTMSDCTFEGNSISSDFGGGLMIELHASADIARCSFIRNAAPNGYGGGVFCKGDALSVVNCSFTGNSAYRGGGLSIQNTNASPIANCTFSNNTASYRGGGMYLLAANPVVTNSIFWGNADARGSTQDAQIHRANPVQPIVNHCIVLGGWSGTGSDNIDADPMFVDPDGADDVIGTADDDLRLSAGSPGIDASDNDAYVNAGGGSTDLNGDPRTHDDAGIDDTGVGLLTYLDIGAFEFQGTTECGAGGDFGNDGDVDLIDYARFANCMGGPGSSLEPNCDCFDLDADGDVDTLDFAEFQVSFTGQ